MACAIVVAIKFRRSVLAAVVGVAAFLLMIFVTGLYTLLPHVLQGDYYKVMGFVGFGHVLASVLLFIALLLAPTRGPDYGPGS